MLFHLCQQLNDKLTVDTTSDDASIFESILQTEVNEGQQDSETDTDGDEGVSAIPFY